MSTQAAARPAVAGRAAPVLVEVSLPDAAGTAVDGAPSPWAGEPSAAWGRVASIAALGALGLHALVAVTHTHEALFAVVLLIMSAVCAVCAVRCLSRPCHTELTALLGMSAAMVLVHIGWFLATGSGTAHHGGAGLEGEPASSGMGMSMLGVALAELLVAGLCALALRNVTSSTK